MSTGMTGRQVDRDDRVDRSIGDRVDKIDMVTKCHCQEATRHFGKKE